METMVMLAVSYFNSYYHYPQKNCQAHYSYGYVNCPEFFRAKIFSRIHYLEYFFFTLLLLTHCTMYLDLITLLPIYMATKRLVVGYILWLREIQFIWKTTQFSFNASMSKVSQFVNYIKNRPYIIWQCVHWIWPLT